MSLFIDLIKVFLLVMFYLPHTSMIFIVLLHFCLIQMQKHTKLTLMYTLGKVIINMIENFSTYQILCAVLFHSLLDDLMTLSLYCTYMYVIGCLVKY